MKVQPDFRELLALFNEIHVEYIVVGAFALALHGAPRFTGDLDIYVKPDSDNARRVMNALQRFGFGSVGLKEDDFLRDDNVVQLGYPPVRIDLLTRISGVSWNEACAGAVDGDFGGEAVRYLGREQLIVNKRATGRKKDLADLEALGLDS